MGLEISLQQTKKDSCKVTRLMIPWRINLTNTKISCTIKVSVFPVQS